MSLMRRRRSRLAPWFDGLEDRVVLDGSLDPTFGAGGKALVATGQRLAEVVGMAVQSDGKVVLAGGSPNANGFIVARQTSAGSADAGFSLDGITTVDFPGFNSVKARGLAIQADGKIVVVGVARDGSGSYFAVARLRSDGSLDTSFDSDGLATVPFTKTSSISDASAYSVVIQPDGKIVVAGESWGNLALARLNLNGSIDTTFHGTGRATVPFDTLEILDGRVQVAIQPDGKIVAAGTAQSGQTMSIAVSQAVARLNADGSLDTTFDADGRQTVSFGVNLPRGASNGLAIQPDGKVLLVGSSTQGIGVSRLTSTGAVDSTFGTAGQVSFHFGQAANVFYTGDYATGVALQADGKIVVSAVANTGALLSQNLDFGAARLTASGALDPSFGNGGLATAGFETSATPTFDMGEAVAIQPDGKVLIAGITQGTNADQFGLVRLLASSSGGGNPPGPTATTTALTASATQIVPGQLVTFTATVSPASATGQVQFLDNGAILGLATLTNGGAAYSTSMRALGTHSITAVYSGNGSYATSTSAARVVVVSSSTTPTVTVTDLTVSASLTTFGQPMTLTAIVSPAAAGGTVRFLDGGTLLATASLSGGVATVSTTALAVGPHNLTAVYDGDASYRTSQSVSRMVAVDPAPNPPPAPPTVLSASMKRGPKTVVTLVFSDNLKPDLARNARNVAVRSLGRGGKALAVAGVRYNAAGRSLVVTISGKLKPAQSLRLSLAPSGYVSTRNVRLDGDGDGRPGGKYVVVLT